MVSSDAQAACEFVRSKPLSDCPYSRFSDCGYAADNPMAVPFAAVLPLASPALAEPLRSSPLITTATELGDQQSRIKPYGVMPGRPFAFPAGAKLARHALGPIGRNRKSVLVTARSALPPGSDIVGSISHVRKVP